MNTICYISGRDYNRIIMELYPVALWLIFKTANKKAQVLIYTEQTGHNTYLHIMCIRLHLIIPSYTPHPGKSYLPINFEQHCPK